MDSTAYKHTKEVPCSWELEPKGFLALLTVTEIYNSGTAIASRKTRLQWRI